MKRKKTETAGTIRKSSRRTAVCLWSLCLTISLLFAGCGSSKGTSADSYGLMSDSAYSSAAENGKYEEASEAVYTNGGTELASTVGQVNSSRKLITTVEMNVETEHYDALTEWISAQMAALGGYAEYSETDAGRYNNSRYGTMKLRIPADRLENFLAGLAGESNVLYSSRSVKDVTLDYVDTESHKEALRVEQERLMQLLEQAESLEDILAVEERLTQVRYELESYESQLRTYDDLIDYSTVNLYISEVKTLTEPEPESFGQRVSAGFRKNLEKVKTGLTEFAIAFLSNIPTILLWAVILGLICFIVMKIRKIRSRKRAAQGVTGASSDRKRRRRKKNEAEENAAEKEESHE